MNPIAAIREMMEAYTEGVRVSKFGPDYDLKRQAATLDIENARAKAAHFQVQNGRDSELHQIRRTGAQRDEEQSARHKREDNLKWSTRLNAAAADKHSADDIGIAEHEAEQEAIKERRATATAAWAEGQGGRREQDLVDRERGLTLRELANARSATAAGQSSDMRELLMEIRRQQAAGTYNPDINNPDPQRSRGRSKLSPEQLEARAVSRLAAQGIAEGSPDYETKLFAMEDEIEAERSGATPIEKVVPPPSTMQAPKVAPSQAQQGGGKKYKFQDQMVSWEQLPPPIQKFLESKGLR